MNKNIIWLVIGVVVFGGIYFFSRGGNEGVNGEVAFETGILNPIDHIKGNASSTIVLMEYSDFQCPACRSYYPLVRQIMAEFGDRIVFVYRHFPLTSIHQNAEFTARASEAAAKQGKFWEMHDLLFEKQNEWAKVADLEPILVNYATLIGLNIEQFKLDWRSKEIKNLVSAQRIHAVKSGLQGTPTFFLAGKKINNPVSIDDFRAVIKKALE